MSNPDQHQPADVHPTASTSTIALDKTCPTPDEPACQDGLFPIRAVANITGVNPITLRAWERRYNLIRPTRTATGHRLYSASDIQEIQRIMALSAQGIGFMQIAQILARESRLAKNHHAPADQSLSAAQESRPEAPVTPSAQGVNLVESLKQAIIHMDPLALRRIEQQAMMWLPPEQVMNSILIEAYRQLEERDSWPDRDMGLHWFGHHVRQRLEWWLLQHARKPSLSHPLVLVDTTTDHRPLDSNECRLIMSLAGKCTVQLITDTLSETQRVRLVNRWQAQHWVRLLKPSEPQQACTGDLLSGSTRLHWCQIISDEQAFSIAPNGVCQGGIIRCQRYLLDQIA